MRFAGPLLHPHNDLSRKCAMTALDACVLIADDDLAVADFVERVLALMGLLAVVVSNGAAAIKVAQTFQGRLDCAILDVMMPDMNGIDAAEAIRRINPDLPIIFMSGFFSPELLERATTMAYVAVLQKPFALSDLRAALTHILHEKELGGKTTPPRMDRGNTFV
jgi:two-component system cell cycle sensor histidine kinase/response regulator CckA